MAAEGHRVVGPAASPAASPAGSAFLQVQSNNRQTPTTPTPTTTTTTTTAGKWLFPRSCGLRACVCVCFFSSPLSVAMATGWGMGTVHGCTWTLAQVANQTVYQSPTPRRSLRNPIKLLDRIQSSGRLHRRRP